MHGASHVPGPARDPSGPVRREGLPRRPAVPRVTTIYKAVGNAPGGPMTQRTSFEDAVAAVRAGKAPQDEAGALFSQLDEQERLWLLDGDEEFWPGLREMIEQGYNRRPYVHGAVPRLGIPGLRFSDGPRGVVMGASTAFPVSMARGATWDTALEERIGDAIGAEAR